MKISQLSVVGPYFYFCKFKDQFSFGALGSRYGPGNEAGNISLYVTQNVIDTSEGIGTTV